MTLHKFIMRFFTHISLQWTTDNGQRTLEAKSLENRFFGSVKFLCSQMHSWTGFIGALIVFKIHFSALIHADAHARTAYTYSRELI